MIRHAIFVKQIAMSGYLRFSDPEMCWVILKLMQGLYCIMAQRRNKLQKTPSIPILQTTCMFISHVYANKKWLVGNHSHRQVERLDKALCLFPYVPLCFHA